MQEKNILVIGGSGSGKTRFFVKPNLLQCHSSYVVTDPKGTILNEVGALLDRKDYRIKSLNLINFKKSMRHNPLAYIRSEKDILKLVNALILNTKGEGEKSSEDFWVKAKRLYYSALIGYIWYEAEPEERNFITLLDLINASEAREDDEEFQSPCGSAVRQAGEGAPGPLHREAIPQIQNGRGQNSQEHFGELRRPPCALRYQGIARHYDGG